MERKIKKRMKKKVTAQKKLKKYHKLNRKMSWLDKVKLWLLQHSKIAFLLVNCTLKVRQKNLIFGVLLL